MADEQKSTDNAASEEDKSLLTNTLADIRAMATDIGDRITKTAAGATEEARSTWSRLEPQVKEKLSAAQHEVENVSEAAAKQLHQIYGDLKSSLTKLREKL